MDDTLIAKKWFHFHSFWVRAPWFLDVVARAWHFPFSSVHVIEVQHKCQALATTSRMRWLWLSRADSSHPWTGFQITEDKVTTQFFKASICYVLGNSSKTLLWTVPLFHGRCMAEWAPDLVATLGDGVVALLLRRSLGMHGWGYHWAVDGAGDHAICTGERTSGSHGAAPLWHRLSGMPC
jgi:hypothetical protein